MIGHQVIWSSLHLHYMPTAPDSNPRTRGAKPRGSLLLDDQLCFALYAASRAVIQLYRPLLEELGLTYPQYLVMLLLWERGEMTIGEIADALELDYGTLSPLLKRLAAAGLLERRRHAEDERLVHITLTEPGRRLESRAGPVCQTVVDAYGVDAQQFSELRARLRDLTDSVSGVSRGNAASRD
jgi:DNA-binding MarR family transcriptional regulator